jgi:protoheme IX farnesyltransferase
MNRYGDLCKTKVSALSAFSAGVGFILASGGMRAGAIVCAAAVFLLACGASGLNQYQERATDALMPRTKGRPLPSGTIRPVAAVFFSLCLIVSGLVILLLTFQGALPFLLGIFALLWYNVIYTFLKKKTAFAAVPGGLAGALPPAIGWIAGGGLPADPRLAFLCFFFFMWQTPHFWLLLLDRGPEYEAAGLPSLTLTFRRSQLLRIVFVWTIAVAASVLLVGLAGVVRNRALDLALCLISVWLIWSGVGIFRKGRTDWSSAFRTINIFAFVSMVLMAIDGLLRNAGS